MIIEPIVVTPIAANCYIVACSDTKDAMVIDPGGDIDLILARITNLGVQVKLIVGTHAHIDHVAGVYALKQFINVPFLLHPAEEMLLKMLPAQGVMFGIPVSGIPTIQRYLHEGDTVEVGRLVFGILETPGHSPGGICLKSTTEPVIFVGDALFEGSIGRTDLPGGDYDTLIAGIQAKLLSLPDETIVYSGHGAPTTIGNERQYNPFLQ